MRSINMISAPLGAAVLVATLQGCSSVPGMPSSGTANLGGTIGSLGSWVGDFVADLGFGSAVSSGLADANQSVPWLADLAGDVQPRSAQSFDLEPGYYRFRVESFCLKPGAYGPQPGDGHLLAPVRGQRAKLFTTILQRAGNHPEIPQEDVQHFLWGIDAGLSLGELPAQVRARIEPLLTAQEKLQLSIDTGEIASQLANRFLSAEAGAAIARFQQIRTLLANAQATYQELEQLAVPLGTAAGGAGSHRVAAGQWSYAGNGFYARTMPESYSTTILEVVRPAPYRIQRDELGRITRFESGPNRIDITYAEGDTPVMVQGPNGERGHIWRFQRLDLKGPRLGETHSIHNRGWIVARGHHGTSVAASRDAVEFGRPRHVGAVANVAGGRGMKATFARHDVGLGRLILARADNASRTGPGFAAWRDRVKDLKKRYDDAKQYKEEFDRATRPADEQALGELLDLENFRKGLEAASNPGDLEGKAASFRDHLWRTRNAWNYANCVFAGECAPPGMDYNPFRRTPSAEDDERGHQGSRGASRRRFDPSGMIAVAGGASRQPLGLTTRIVGGYR